MIYTITFNPSLDYVMKVPLFEIGKINRVIEEKIYPGGKGINVSIVLKNLGIPSKTLGFSAGFSGNELKRLLLKEGCECDFVEVNEGCTRINMKIASNGETAINGLGPKIKEEHIEKLLSKLNDLKAGDFIVFAGSIPNFLSNDIYERIISRIKGKKVHIIIDAIGELLLKSLKYRPFLIKPNHEELGELFNLPPLQNSLDIIRCAQKLHDMGAQNVLVSRGKDGAILLNEAGEVYCSGAPEGNLVNSVGAGDSMVAGFIAGFLKNKNYSDAFHLGLCAGSASAFSEWLPDKTSIYKLLSEL